MEKIIIIAGPTGVGKSDFAELLAQRINGEIINADQGQLYEPLSIGTAKPDWKNHSIPHHLFDHITQPLPFSNASYQKIVKECIKNVQSRGKRAIVVGGSGFYYQMLLFEFSSPSGHGSTNTGSSLPSFTHTISAPITWEHLKEIDPERARSIHPHDKYRIERALDIFYNHHLLPSSLQMEYKPYGPYCLVHVVRDTHELYDRINERTNSMLQQGWLQEVAGLSDTWKKFLRIKKIIGYDDIEAYQNNIFSYEELVLRIQKKTRNYAKRQRTYFRSLIKKIPTEDHKYIHEINLTLSSVDLYLNQLVERL